MPRTKEIASKSTGGQATRWPPFQTQHLKDHHGDKLVRVRSFQLGDPIPEDFVEEPVFCIQIYTTVDLGLDETDEPGSERVRTDVPASDDNLAKLVYYLTDNFEREQWSIPVLDIYETVQANAFTAVEHQKEEIRHREANFQDPRVLQIPKLVYDTFDSRKHGFLIVNTSRSFHRWTPGRDEQVDPDGPLWVRFDRRSPESSSAERSERMELDEFNASEAESWGDEVVVFPEKMEIEVERKQRIATMSTDLVSMVSDSRKSLDVSSGPSSAPDSADVSALTLDQHEADAQEVILNIENQSHGTQLEVPGCEVEVYETSISIRSAMVEGGIATLAYPVFVRFAPGANVKILEAVARRFTSALLHHLPSSLTIHLEFYAPQHATLSSVISAAKELQLCPATDARFGALVSDTEAPSSSSQSAHSPDNTQHQQNRRLLPISRHTDRKRNDPLTSRVESYKTFLVVLDRPDFIDSPGVLFVMSDGGRFKVLKGVGSSFFGPTTDFIETQVLRSAGMHEVARRLCMEFGW